MGRTSSAAAFSDGSEGFQNVTDVTAIKENFGDLNIRHVPRFLLYQAKIAALNEDVTLRRYVVKLLEIATSGDLADLEIDFRD